MARSLQRTSTQPLAVPRSARRHPLTVLTTLPAGKMVPVGVIPLLREDALESMTVRFSAEMMETVEVLMNDVNLHVKAYLVPHLAFERFSGMDELNRSWDGKPNQEGGPVTPFFEAANWGISGENPIFRYLGKHTPPTGNTNGSYIEAYNAIWNFRARNRSPSIPLRNRIAPTLAPAFWQHEQFSHIVPVFDQAKLDGEVPLIFAPGTQLPVKNKVGGIRVEGSANATVGPLTVLSSNGIAKNGAAPVAPQVLNFATDATGSNVYAELQGMVGMVTLANIDMARKVQSFAKLREQFVGHTDEYIIDLLMDGLTVPEQAWRQPILLAEDTVQFGMSKRYASDGGNLTESVVNGMTGIEMRLRCPRVPCGGVIMITAEVTPGQLFERQFDPYLQITSPEQMPHYQRDFLDPEKVEVVTNSYIDTAHATPNGVFGYAPLNHKWNHSAPCIGGEFYRPTVNSSFDEKRQRIWAVETANPTLSADFYLCNQMHTKPFVVTNQDPFELVIRGEGLITGNTVFGAPVIEGNDDWDEVMAEVPMDKIVLP